MQISISWSEKIKKEEDEKKTDQAWGHGVNTDNQLQQQLIAKEAENALLKRELDEEHVQTLSLEREVKDLRTLVTKQQGNILKLEMQSNDTTTKLQEQEKDNEELKKVLDEKDKEKEEYKKKHDGYFKQLNELISQLEEKDGEIRAYQREIDELKDKHGTSNLSKLTEENEVWKLQASVYHEDFDRERFEKEQIQSVREQERGQQAELHRENQLLREQLQDEWLQGDHKNRRLGELERENISLREQLNNATLTIQGQQLIQDVLRHRLDREARRFRRAVRNLRVARAHIQNLTMTIQRQHAVQNVVLIMPSTVPESLDQ